MLKIGERLVVMGLKEYPAIVEKVWFDQETDRTVIELDWGEHGKSRVYAHDENKSWYRYTNSN